MKQRQNLVVKSNALIEAGHRLSLAEQRIVLSAIAQMRRDETPDSRHWYSVTAQELSAISGIDSSDAYDDLESGAERLWDRTIVVRGGPNGNSQTPKGIEILKTRWVQSVHYIPKEGRVDLMFSELVTPYLIQLREQFTQYQLQHVAPMRSRFGPRLYELLAQWRKFGEIEASIDWLQECWGTRYKRFFDFKKRVVIPAIKDVNNFSDLSVDWKEIKTGRRITAIRFIFEEKRKKNLRQAANIPTNAYDPQNKQTAEHYSRTPAAKEASQIALAQLKAMTGMSEDQKNRDELERRGQKRFD